MTPAQQSPVTEKVPTHGLNAPAPESVNTNLERQTVSHDAAQSFMGDVWKGWIDASTKASKAIQSEATKLQQLVADGVLTDVSPKPSPVSDSPSAGPMSPPSPDSPGAGPKPPPAPDSPSAAPKSQLSTKPTSTDASTQSVPELPINSDFASEAKEVFAKLDTTGKGVLTQQQIAAALENPSLTGQEEQVVAALNIGFESWVALSGNSGVLTQKGLDNFGQNWQQYALESLDSSGVQSLFSTIGTNGTISAQQVETALNNPKNQTFVKLPLLTSLQDNFSKINGGNPITLAELNTYATSLIKQKNGQTGEAAFVSAALGVGNVSQIQALGVDGKLYANSDQISAAGAVQGGIGDCTFEAALSSIAQSNPQLITNAIKDNGNGTYTVTFPGALNDPITVQAPTDAELATYAHATPQGTWGAVMEKAYGAYLDQHFWRRPWGAMLGVENPQDAANGSLLPGTPLQLLSGKSNDTQVLPLHNESEVAQTLATAFSSTGSHEVTAGTASNIWDPATSSDGFINFHEYSVLGFTQGGPGGGTVTVRNPWGVDSDTPEGTMSISMDEFVKNFDLLTYTV